MYEIYDNRIFFLESAKVLLTLISIIESSQKNIQVLLLPHRAYVLSKQCSSYMTMIQEENGDL